MTTTTYRIEVADGIVIETESAFVAGLESNDGCRVTAITEATDD